MKVNRIFNDDHLVYFISAAHIFSPAKFHTFVGLGVEPFNFYSKTHLLDFVKCIVPSTPRRCCH